jgi:molecular chaperone IbpA
MISDFIINHSIGLSKFMDDLEAMQYGTHKSQGFPPHRIIRDGDKYSLQMTVAGYLKEDISVELKDSETLLITSDGATLKYEGALYDGIATRGFKKEFKLSPYMEVSNVSLKDGILEVQLSYELPEEKKPKQLTIN